jgi:hypothetical protein
LNNLPINLQGQQPNLCFQCRWQHLSPKGQSDASKAVRQQNMESRSASCSTSALAVEEQKYQINIPNQPIMSNMSTPCISTSSNKYDIHSSFFGSTNHLFILFRDVWSVTTLLEGLIMIYWEVHDSLIQETSSPREWVSENKTFLLDGDEYQLNLVYHANTIRLTSRNLNDSNPHNCLSIIFFD